MASYQLVLNICYIFFSSDQYITTVLRKHRHIHPSTLSMWTRKTHPLMLITCSHHNVWLYNYRPLVTCNNITPDFVDKIYTFYRVLVACTVVELLHVKLCCHIHITFAQTLIFNCLSFSNMITPNYFAVHSKT